GESYVTALRHVRGVQGESVPVIELVDISDVGAALGMKCRVMVLPALAESIDVTATLQQLRTVLLSTTRDRALDLMRAVVLCGERPFSFPPTLQEGLRFLARTRFGIGGVCPSGRMLAFSVDGRSGSHHVVFMLWLTASSYLTVPPSLVLTTARWSLGD